MAVAALVLVAGTAVAGFQLAHLQVARPFQPPDGCVVTALGQSVSLEPEQAVNATTIAAVAARRGLPPHAVTIALAAALQESKLVNLPAGDRDSIGLFQQRPSQGWGRPDQIRDPRYAAARFYARLVQVQGWATIPVAVAAQQVQRSADGSAYAYWETAARSLAEGLTGHAGAGVACTYRHLRGDPASLRTAIAADFGVSLLDRPQPNAFRGWALAGWLVAHAAQHRLARVSYLGRTWTASTGHWRAAGPVSERVQVGAAPPPR